MKKKRIDLSKIDPTALNVQYIYGSVQKGSYKEIPLKNFLQKYNFTKDIAKTIQARKDYELKHGLQGKQITLKVDNYIQTDFTKIIKILEYHLFEIERIFLKIKQENKSISISIVNH